jgi:hypothetical protein
VCRFRHPRKQFKIFLKRCFLSTPTTVIHKTPHVVMSYYPPPPAPMQGMQYGQPQQGYAPEQGYPPQPQYGGPPPPQQMSAIPPQDAGLGFLASIDGLYIQQRVEVFEALTGCDTKNRYHITPIPAGAIPDPARGTLPETWLAHFRAQSEFAPMLKAKEESDFCARQCCPGHRKFDMAFKDGAGQTFFSIHRPFKCTIPCACCLVNPQELTLYDAGSVPAARAEEEFKCCWICTKQFKSQTFDTPGAPPNNAYHTRVPECSSSRGCNMFAPSCLNRDYDMDIYDASETAVVGHAAAVWPGCNCGGLTERSNLVLRFPPNATPKQRAALVASTFLVEFYHFELKRQNN